MKTFIVFCILAQCSFVVIGNRIYCEPRSNNKESIRFWYSKYGIKPELAKTRRFLAEMISKSNDVFTNSSEPRTPYEINWGLTERHRHISYVWITHTNMRLTFSYPTINVFFSFAHGDTLIIHSINKKTGKLTTRELGFHSRKFFTVVKPDSWHAFEFPKHRNEEYALISTTAIGTGDGADVVYATVEKMIEKYPNHEEFIRRFY